jgi:hypothetical protein
MSTIITAHVAPASAKEPSYDSRSRVVTRARAGARASARAGARAICARANRIRAGAAQARTGAESARAIERHQFGALTAYVPSRDERSPSGCGATGDLWPGHAILGNQTGGLRS